MIKRTPWHLVIHEHRIDICPDHHGEPAGVVVFIGSRGLAFHASRTGSHRGERMVYRPFSEQDIATARIIAAAPDLLDALKSAIETIRTWHGMDCGAAEPQMWEAYQESPEIRRINAAIAKAEGA